MEWGKDYTFLLEIYEDTGVMPPALARKPELLEAGTKYLDAYYALHRARGYNDGGRQPFLISEISAYLTLAGITGVERKMKFLTLLQSLDQVALNYYAEQAKRTKP